MALDKQGKIQAPLIGQLAVKNLLITKEELQKGLVHCSESKNKTRALKEYFLSNELISSENIERLDRAAKTLEFRQKEFKFGAIAIRKGFINQSVLTLALEEQQNEIKSKKKMTHIGEMLVDAGLLTEQQQNYILKLQKRVKNESQKILSKEIKTIDTVQEDQTSEASGGVSDATSGKILENADDKNLLQAPKIIAGGIMLEVSKDFMTAFFTKTDSFDKDITLEQIKEVLFDKNIVSGVVVDEMIQGFISSSGFTSKAFKIAQGILPIQGKNARVEFFFNTDYLKAGGMTEDGVIDFKDRGEIPHVEEGTVLAEKIPMVESRHGNNIYGDVVETVPGIDLAINYGTGVKISEDGIKLIATVTGCPKFSLSGRIFVHEEYITQGDVDYETGHIDYDGNVNVKGRIKSGFKVKGNDISAIELDGGILTAEGNVKIAGGINEAKIYSRGNVYANFIHNSKIECMGNVVITREIVDSDIECSGRCAVENGKIMSSLVTSKMGVKARNIGSEKAGPCLIKVGHDVFIKKELASIKDKVDGLEKTIGKYEKKKEDLTNDNKELQKQITELAHIQDRAQLEEKEINSKIALIERNAKNIESIKKMKIQIEHMQADALNAETKLDVCFNESEKIEEVIEKEDKEIKPLKTIRRDLLTEKANLIKLTKENPGQSIVNVAGTIMNGTVITGLHSEKRISEEIRHSKVVETLCVSDEGKSLNVYEMQVKNV